MARAGKEGTPVFLVGGKPEVLAQTEANADAVEVNTVGSQTVTLRRSVSAICAYPCQRRENCHRRDGDRQNRNYSCAINGKCIPMRYIWGWADPRCLPVTSNAPQKWRWQNLGLEWLYRLLSLNRKARYPPDASAAPPSLALYWRS